MAHVSQGYIIFISEIFFSADVLL